MIDQLPVNKTTYLSSGKENYVKLADDMEITLRRDVLRVWFPRFSDSGSSLETVRSIANSAVCMTQLSVMAPSRTI